MTYYALVFLANERRRTIDVDYQRAIGAQPLRVRLGNAFVTIGTSLLGRPVRLEERVP